MMMSEDSDGDGDDVDGKNFAKTKWALHKTETEVKWNFLSVLLVALHFRVLCTDLQLSIPKNYYHVQQMRSYCDRLHDYWMWN